MKQQRGQGADSLANIFNILEQQSQLLKRLQETVSRTKESLLQDDHKSSSQEFFTAILTSQYAILSKFDEVASIRLSNTDGFHPATAALHDAEDAANVRAHATKEQSQEIEALRMKVEKTTAHDVELLAEVAVLEQRLKDIRQERDELRSSLKDKESRLEGAMKKDENWRRDGQAYGPSTCSGAGKGRSGKVFNRAKRRERRRREGKKGSPT